MGELGAGGWEGRGLTMSRQQKKNMVINSQHGEGLKVTQKPRRSHEKSPEREIGVIRKISYSFLDLLESGSQKAWESDKNLGSSFVWSPASRHSSLEVLLSGLLV